MVEIYPQRFCPALAKSPLGFYGWLIQETAFPPAAPCKRPPGVILLLHATERLFIDKNFGFLYDYLYALFRVQCANWPNQNKPTQAQALLAQASGARRLIPRCPVPAYLENPGQAALARLYGEYFL